MVASLGQGQAGFLSQQFNDAGGEALGGVDAGTNRGAAQGDFGNTGQGGVDALNTVAHLGCVARELLAQGYGGGVHQVGAAGLDNVFELHSLALQGLGQVFQRRDQVLEQGLGRGHMHGGGEDIVRRLRGVHVVVGVDLDVLTFQGLVGQGRQNLVGVHVR